MANTNIVADGNELRMERIVALVGELDALETHLDEMEAEQIDGSVLWLGGFPKPLNEVRSMLRHQKTLLTTAFPFVTEPIAEVQA